MDTNTRQFLLVTGWAHTAAVWQPLLKKLAPGLPPQIVTLPDLSADTPINGIPDYAAALASRLRKLPSPPVLIGWSVGAMAALAVAARHPQLVHRLVLLAGTARFCRDADYPCGQPSASLRNLRRQLQRAPRAALAGFFTMANAPSGLDDTSAELLIDGALAQGLPHLTAGLDYLEQADLRPVLANVTMPVLLIHGRHDQVIARQAGGYLAERLPNASLMLVDAGHVLPVQQPDKLADIILHADESLSKVFSVRRSVFGSQNYTTT